MLQKHTQLSPECPQANPEHILMIYCLMEIQISAGFPVLKKYCVSMIICTAVIQKDCSIVTIFMNACSVGVRVKLI